MWSKIQNTHLARVARSYIILNEQRGCNYHNRDHVDSMYQYLEDTNEPYDEALDWAVLFHDIVYDDKPEKEYRSAVMFKERAVEYDGCNPDIWERERTCQLILQTADHVHNERRVGSSAIIRADLHALTNSVQTFRNFTLIMHESMNLYNIDELTFANNNIKFMDGLYKRVERNMELDPDHREFYNDVKRGIVSTINLSRILQGDL